MAANIVTEATRLDNMLGNTRVFFVLKRYLLPQTPPESVFFLFFGPLGVAARSCASRKHSSSMSGASALRPRKLLVSQAMWPDLAVPGLSSCLYSTHRMHFSGVMTLMTFVHECVLATRHSLEQAQRALSRAPFSITYFQIQQRSSTISWPCCGSQLVWCWRSEPSWP